METDSHASDLQIKKMQEDIKEMNARFDALSGDVKILQESQAAIRENVNTVSGSFEKLSGSIEEIIRKLDAISEDQKKSGMSKIMDDGEGFLNKAVRKPLRKLAVGTVSAIMAVADFAVEKAAGAKEGLEDIVAEASYHNKKRRSRTYEEAPASAE
jgi:ABC-type transporter Mla subunit MlaD